MLHVGLDLSRKRVDVCVVSSEGELVEHFWAPCDRDGLCGLTRRVAVYGEPVRGVVDPEKLTSIAGVQSHRVDAGLHQLSVSELHTTVPRIFAALAAEGLHLSEFRTHSATLEDVFVQLTGRNLRDE